MKFGKYLESQVESTWSDRYVDYKGIRKSLKRFKSEIESLNIHISELKAYNLNNATSKINSKQPSPTTATATTTTIGISSSNGGSNLLRNSISTSKFMNISQTPLGSSTPMPSDQITAINTSKSILESMEQLKEIQDRLVKSLTDEVSKVNDFYMEREKEAQERFDKLKIQVPLYLKSKEKQRRENEKELNDHDELLSYSESYHYSKKKNKLNNNNNNNSNTSSTLTSPPPLSHEQQQQQPEIKRINQHHAVLNLTPIKSTPLSPKQQDGSSKKEVKISLLSSPILEEEEEEEEEEDDNIHDQDPEVIEMATVYHYDEDELEEVLSDNCNDNGASDECNSSSNNNNGAGSGGGGNNNSQSELNLTFDIIGSKISKSLKEISTHVVKPTTTFFQPLGDRAKRFMSMGKQKSDEALLKEAFREYYHFLVILKNYQVINYTGFVKIIKKSEKNTGLSIGSQVMSFIECQQFRQSKKIERLTSSIEKIHSELFNNGKIRDARKQLRNSEHVSQQSPTISNFFSGVCAGWTSALLMLIYYFIYTKEFDDFVRFSSIYNAYSAFGLVLLWAFIFGIDCWVWTKSHVHYSFIFELSKNKFNHVKIFQAVTLLSVMWITSIGVYMWQSVSGDDFPFPFVPPEYNPLVLFGAYMLILVCPFNIFQLSVRKWFLNTVFRVLTAPIKSVKFKDFFMGDQLSSLVLMIVQFAQFVCFYTYDVYRPDHSGGCIRYARYFNPFISGLPAYCRLMQCFRRYYDSYDSTTGKGDTVHLRNAVKYSLSIVVVVCSTLDGFFSGDSGWHSPYRLIWVVAGVSNSMYSYWWDLICDWSIVVRPKGQHWNPFKWTLRKRRMYQPTFVYYFAIFSNLGFRTTWTFTKSLPQLTNILPSYKLVVVIGIIEILRRGQWNIFRLENEHLNNCGKFRVTREIPLPYQIRDNEN
ncbi:hypothetical protein ACTFIW_008634 [Dictyostelium discoideum]